MDWNPVRLGIAAVLTPEEAQSCAHDDPVGGVTNRLETP
jgi:hypothetical protein